MTGVGTRQLSGAVFNNDKFVEVVLALDSEEGTATAQQVASRVGINHDLAKKVLDRLDRAHLVKPTHRVAGPRSALPYEVQRGEQWTALVRLARLLAAEPPA